MKIRSDERNAILQSLASGLVPKKGLQHIQVGRQRELVQLDKDLGTVSEGGAVVRFVVGEFGSGKTFFLTLAKQSALGKKLVVLTADLNPNRRLHGGDGQAVSLFNELLSNLTTPSGGTLKSIIERFITLAQEEAEASEQPLRKLIRDKLNCLQELVTGFDFAEVLNLYYEAYEAQDEQRQRDCLRWLKGEFNSKVEARKALGVRNMVDDETVYDFIKLYAKFVVLAGYKGLVVCVDEMVSISQMQSSHARNANYDTILRIVNDINQGSAEHLGFLFGGTPDFVEGRRGMYSHGALETRLRPDKFALPDRPNLSHPVWNLPLLTRAELTDVLRKISAVASTGKKALIDETGINLFLESQFSSIGDAAFRMPRDTVKEFTSILNMIEQYPGTSVAELVGRKQPAVERNDVSLANFRVSA